MKNIKISVIIPVYNVEKTLSRCVDSIINQTMKDIEIILVDDGSVDNSGVICDNYVRRHDNIQVIHKENEGLGPTRNAGVEIAKGEYIYHCDSDDWVEPKMLEEVYFNAKKNDAQAVIFGYKLLTEKKGEIKEYGTVTGNNTEFLNTDAIQDFFILNQTNFYFTQSACNRLTKRDFLENNKIKFKPFRRSQDVIFSLDLFDKLEKLNVMSNIYYNYIIEPGKFKGRSFDEMIGNYLDVYNELRNHFINWGKLNNSNAKKLTTLYIVHISNYASYFIIRKSGNQKLKIIDKLFNEERIQTLFKSIDSSDLSSRFIKISRYAIIRKKRVFLLFIFLLHQIKQGIKM